MWSLTKLSNGLSPARRVRRTVLGDLDLNLCEPRRLLSLAMPAAEIGAVVPPHSPGVTVGHAPAVAEWVGAAGAASTNSEIETNLDLPAVVADDDPPTDPGQGGGDIPPVIGKVSW